MDWVLSASIGTEKLTTIWNILCIHVSSFLFRLFIYSFQIHNCMISSFTAAVISDKLNYNDKNTFMYGNTKLMV